MKDSKRNTIWRLSLTMGIAVVFFGRSAQLSYRAEVVQNLGDFAFTFVVQDFGNPGETSHEDQRKGHEVEVGTHKAQWTRWSKAFLSGKGPYSKFSNLIQIPFSEKQPDQFKIQVASGQLCFGSKMALDGDLLIQNRFRAAIDWVRSNDPGSQQPTVSLKEALTYGVPVVRFDSRYRFDLPKNELKSAVARTRKERFSREEMENQTLYLLALAGRAWEKREYLDQALDEATDVYAAIMNKQADVLISKSEDQAIFAEYRRQTAATYLTSGIQDLVAYAPDSVVVELTEKALKKLKPLSKDETVALSIGTLERYLVTVRRMMGTAAATK